VKRAAADAVLTGAALLFAFVETIIPLGALPLPGFKAGLANIAILFAAFALSVPDAAAVSLARSLLTFLLFGSPTSLLFSLSGGILVITVLAVLKSTAAFRHMSFIGISVLTAAAHNTGQLFAAVLLTGEALFSYLPALLAASLFYGCLTGVILNLLPHRFYLIPSNLFKNTGGTP